MKQIGVEHYLCLSVGLGDALKLVLLLDGVAVGAALGGVDRLVGQALGDRLDVPERGLAGVGAQQPDGLVEAAQWRDVDRLPTRAGVDDGADQHLQGVFSGGEVDDLEAVLGHPHVHQLLAVVPPVHHQGVTSRSTIAWRRSVRPECGRYLAQLSFTEM